MTDDISNDINDLPQTDLLLLLQILFRMTYWQYYYYSIIWWYVCGRIRIINEMTEESQKTLLMIYADNNIIGPVMAYDSVCITLM